MFGKHKLTDALKNQEGSSKPSGAKGRGGATQADLAEQVREAHERAAAKNAEASIRDRMVDIGRGNQQAGRQGSGNKGS